MNAVEIADAVTELSQQPFDPAEFPFQFLSTFDNSPTTIKRLRAPSAASTNKSDIAGAVLQRNNIHILVTPPGKVSEGLVQLQESPATAKAKARFLLATDGMLVKRPLLVGEDFVLTGFRPAEWEAKLG